MDKLIDTETKESALVEAISISELTYNIKDLLENGIGKVFVRGEISNWRPAASGHIYFSLKDAETSISSAMFRGVASRIKTKFKDGMEVECRGKISVYPLRGTYQIIVDSMSLVGEGSLQAKFEALKQKLHKEGLFDSSRKKSLPAMPERIVVVTSPTGAAIKDVLSVLKRRYAGVKVLVYPTLVQGEEAPIQMIAALEAINRYKLGDVILLTRGGGSIEDLWCFNDENLARAIAKSDLPIVSAVGHEIDFTIADFVADLRAPTPSAAAELLVREHSVLLESVTDLKQRLVSNAKNNFRRFQMNFREILSKLKNPKDKIIDLQLRFDDWTDRLISVIDVALKNEKRKLDFYFQNLNALSPLKVLERGYSITFLENGTAVKNEKEIPLGSKFSVKLSRGDIKATRDS
ncbi:MAG: exodeoxyribonuclease VII large subunit [Oligoflexia bacterium]|nr:exodeoxyribonuclease VII large subunit [Oligoflexia bacterium]